MGAGVLPVAFHKGTMYFLFSRESLHRPDRDKGKWSDFGGSKENKETPFQTAIREGSEESAGLLGSPASVRRLIKECGLGHIAIKHYTTYLVSVQYDKTLPAYFSKQHEYVWKNNPDLILKHNGLYEKDRLAWVPLKSLKNFSKKRMRRWYRPLVDKIIAKYGK